MTGPIPLRVVDRPHVPSGGRIRLAYPQYGYTVQPGDMWHEEAADGRPACWAIVLPNLLVWRTTETSSDGQPWQVTGDAPALTVTPSLDDTNDPAWHGWITDGELVTCA